MSDVEAAEHAWPAVTTEQLPWTPSDTVPVSRTARRRYWGDYAAAIAPKIASCEISLPSELAAQVEEAAAEIARFDAELGHEIAPFSAVLLRSESAASSKIENLTASARAIAEAELNPTGRGNASLIVANSRSMEAAIALADRVDGAAILDMHEALLGDSNPANAGRWRTEQVWIGGGDYGPHGATFVPPHHHRVEAAIDDLVTYIARDDVPVLAHAAIAHAQFETIHPFPDGNGRTGRALLHAQLRNKGLTRTITVPVSAGLLINTDAYFAALTRYRAGEPLAIIEQVAGAAYSSIQNGRQLVDDLRATRESWQDRIKVRRGATAWRIVDLVLRHPVVNAALIAAELDIKGPNVYRALKPLVDAEVLVEFTDKKRHQLWRASEVLDALDGFAARAGRRSRATKA
jgi:Fic family protein